MPQVHTTSGKSSDTIDALSLPVMTSHFKWYSFPVREPIPSRVKYQKIVLMSYPNPHNSNVLHARRSLGPLIQHLDWPNLTVFPLCAAALNEIILQDNFVTCNTSYVTALLLSLTLNSMLNWIVPTPTASTTLPSPRPTFSGVENDWYLVKYPLLGVMWLDAPESTNHLSSGISSDMGNAPPPSLSDSTLSSVTFAQCCAFSFRFGQNRWTCPTSSQVQALWGVSTFELPLVLRALGFDSWALSFQWRWISCCWTKSIVRSSTRASRAVTTVENDGGEEWRPDLLWRSVHQLSWVCQLVPSFPLGACQ